MRRIIAEDHGLRPENIVLLKPGTIPKTTSGKIMRRRTKGLYLDDQLSQLSSFITKLRS